MLREQTFVAFPSLSQVNFTLKRVLRVIVTLRCVLPPLVFPSHFVHLSHHVGLASFSLFLFFGWGSEEEAR